MQGLSNNLDMLAGLHCLSYSREYFSQAAEDDILGLEDRSSQSQHPRAHTHTEISPTAMARFIISACGDCYDKSNTHESTSEFE